MRISVLVAGLLSFTVAVNPLTPSQEEALRERIRATLFVPDPLPQLNPETHGSFEPTPGVTARRVTYGTQFGMRVPAILYLPKPVPRRKIPGLIVVNGHGGDKYSWYAFYAGILYARAGAAVLTYDPVGEGERNINRKSGTRAHDKVVPPDEMGRRMGGLMVTDIMQAVSLLTEQPEVDSRRIGAMGYSMGSFTLSLACAVDARLSTCVLVGGGDLDGPGGYWDTNNKPMCQSIPYKSLSFLGDRPAGLYALQASHARTLVFNGLEDEVVAIPTHGESFFEDLQKRAAQLHGGSGGVFEFQFDHGSHRPWFLTRPVALWLEKQLHFPNWTTKRIAKMPDTHIIEWAHAQGVDMDRGYVGEDREGGTRALDSDVPGLSRTDLSVFKSEEWERQKDRLIYESWVQEAKANLIEGR